MADTPRSGEQTPDPDTFGSSGAPSGAPHDNPSAEPSAPELHEPAPESAEFASADAAPEPDVDEAPPPPPASFDDFELPPRLRQAIAAMGWDAPTAVQTMTFDLVREGRDVLVQSQTGSGKTGAFCLPWLANRFEPGPASQTGVQLLVLTPTRELAKQVCEQLGSLAEKSELVSLPIYGGTAMQPQLQSLRDGVHAVVGTPGRILDHIRRRSLDLSRVRMVVLDEADEMLSMGFLEDIHNILEACATERQTTLFSATVPPDIERIARRYMRNPEPVRLSGDQVAAAEIDHTYYGISGTMRVRDLVDVINLEEPTTGIVFCNTREETNIVASVLQREGFAAEALSSDLTQTARERVMGWMRSGTLRFLVATDVASRGIDISHVSHVINYTFPENAESYIHRTGRTGRAGRPGVAISLVAPQELGSFYMLKKMYPSLRFDERKLPSPGELEAQRIETKLDVVSKLFPELVSPDWTLLARNLMKDPRGERVIAYLLSEEIPRRRQKPALLHRDDEDEPERIERGRGGRDRGRDREGRDGVRGRDRDRFRATGTDGEPRDRDRERSRSTRTEDEARDGVRGRDRDRDRLRTRGTDDDGRRRRRRGRDEQARVPDEGGTPSPDEPTAQGVASPAPEPERHVPASDVPREERRESDVSTEAASSGDGEHEGQRRRRRRRRGKRKPESDTVAATAAEAEAEDDADATSAVTLEDAPAIGGATEAQGTGAAAGEGAVVAAAVAGVETGLALAGAIPEGVEATDEGARVDGEPSRRRRRRRRRRRGAGGETSGDVETSEVEAAPASEDTESGADGGDEESRRRRRRRRGGRRRGSRAEGAPVVAAPSAPPHVSQDQIIIDIDESELEVVRDQFGEIDELDDLTLKGRRRGVIDDLQDEVELEDLSDDPRPTAAGDETPSGADDDDTGDDEGDDDTDEGDEADDDAAAAQSPDDAKKLKRRRRRRRKKKEEAPPPELTAPPHKDFWEVWAAKFTYREFEDEVWYQSHAAPPPDEPAPSPSSREPSRVSVSMAAAAEDDASFISLRLNIGRKHGKKAAHIRELLDTQLGLSGKAVRNLTVGDASTRLRVSEQNFERVQQTLGGYVLDEHELVITRIEAPAEAESTEAEGTGEPAPAEEPAQAEPSGEVPSETTEGATEPRPPEGGEPSETVFG